MHAAISDAAQSAMRAAFWRDQLQVDARERTAVRNSTGWHGIIESPDSSPVMLPRAIGPSTQVRRMVSQRATTGVNPLNEPQLGSHSLLT